MNTPLPLSPFPALPRTAAAGRIFVRTPAAMEGFVDEDVINRLVARPPLEACPPAFRFAVVPGDLVLPAEEQDYAGGLATPPVPQPSRQAEPAVRAPLGLGRATAPVLEKPGQAHHGGQRWWLAGVAGAFSTTLIAVVLLTLTQPPVASVPAAPAGPAKPTDSAAAKSPPQIQEMISSPTLPPPVEVASP